MAIKGFWKRFQWGLLALALALLPGPARAQDFTVGIATVTQPVFAAAACATTQVNINNRGQSVHYLLYQTTGTINSIAIEFQGRNDTTSNWFTISAAATNTASGGIAANAYVNFVRVNMTACSGTGTITATYSGTSIADTPQFGIFALGLDSFERCNSQAVIQFTAGGAGSTRIITATGGGRRVVVCHISLSVSTAVDVIIEQGTGANCATGNVDLTGAYENILTLALDFGYWSALRTTAVIQDICLNVSAATVVGGVVVYAEL